MRKYLSKFVFAITAIFALAVNSLASANVDQDDAALTKKVDALFAQWDKPGSPGCALGVIRDGHFIYQKGYGMANLDHNIPISVTTTFYIASTSKQFTAMSIALLARSGKISLDDDIRKYLPEIPQYQSPITIRHLIYHTSGIRDYLDLTGLSGRRTEDVNTDDDFIKVIARQKNLNFKPGEKYLYSNSGYFLLSQIVKRAGGKSLRAFADENLFKPLGMANTHFHDNRGDVIKNRATGYNPRIGGFSVVATHFDRVGDGGLFSSVEDLLLWDRNFYDNKLPGGADFINGLHMVGTLNDGEKIDYAFALIPANFKGLKMISHGGSFNGYRAELIRFPEQKFSVACLCNLGNINSTGLATKVAEIFLEKHLKQPNDGQPAESAFVTLSEQELNTVAGLYFNPVTETFRRIVAKDGKLSYVRGPGNESELKALDARRFLMVGTPSRAEVSFKASHLGKEKNMYVVTGTGKPDVFEPVKQVAYTPDELSKFAAVFYSEELDARYNLSIKEGKLIVSVGAEELLLEVLSPDTFASPQGIVVRFRRDQQNRISGFSLSSSRVKGIVFNKV